MPEDIKRIPTVNIVIQEFSVLERLDTIAEMYDRDRNTLIPKRVIYDKLVLGTLKS